MTRLSEIFDRWDSPEHRRRYEEAERQSDALRKRREERRAIELWEGCGIPQLHREKIEFPAARLIDPIAHAGWGSRWGVIEGKLGQGTLLILLGPRGTGKTQAAALAAAVSCAAGNSTRYTSARRMFMAIKGAYRPDAARGEEEEMDDLARPSLLIVDELQERAESEWEGSTLAAVCDERYGAQRDTILIGNQTPEAFAAAIGPSVIDRAREVGGVVQFDWPSFRGAGVRS